MENFKKILLGIIIGYTVIIAYNCISDIYITYITTNKTETYSNIEQYDEMMELNREKLTKYQKAATTDEQSKCLSSINTMIDHSYKTYYTEPIKYNKIIDDYYSDQNNSNFINYGDVVENCTISHETRISTSSILLSNMVMRDSEMLRKKGVYFTKPKKGIVYRTLNLISEPVLSGSTFMATKINEATIIKMVLDEVGDTYE